MALPFDLKSAPESSVGHERLNDPNKLMTSIHVIHVCLLETLLNVKSPVR